MNKLRKNFLLKVIVIFAIVLMLLSSVSFATSGIPSPGDTSFDANDTVTSQIGQISSAVTNTASIIGIFTVLIMIGIPVIFSIIGTIMFIRIMKNIGEEEKRIKGAKRNIIIILVIYTLVLIYNLFAVISSLLITNNISSIGFGSENLYSSVIINILNLLWTLYCFINLIIIYKLYKKSPTSTAKIQKILAIFLMAIMIITNFITAVLSDGFGLNALLSVLLTVVSYGFVIALFLLYDSIIILKAISSNGSEYEEIDKNKIIVWYSISALMAIVFLIEPFYTYNTMIKPTDELFEDTSEALEQYEEASDNENQLLQNLMDYIDSSMYEPETNNNILGYDNSIDNYYIDNTVIDNNINESNIISNSVSGGNNTINNEINLDLPQLEQLVGDINGDEKVSMTDLSLLKGHIVKTKILEGSQYSAADINADGNISMTDFAKLKVIILGL